MTASFPAQAVRAITYLLSRNGQVAPSDVWSSGRISCQPKDRRELGTVFRALSTSKKIQHAGFRICPRPARNGGYERIWRRVTP